MALNKYKLGRFIEKLDNKNSDLRYGVEYAVGVSNENELMPTKADLNGRNLAKFSIIYPGDFVYNHRTSRHGDKFCIAYNTTQENLICTEDYTIFRIKDDCKNKLLNEYLYMFFHRPEMDRFVMYSSWGSSTEFFNWDDVCDIDIELPDLPTQQKYVDIYNAMVANQKSYERGLEDLKKACDIYYDKNKNYNLVYISELINVSNKKNQDSVYGLESLRGISDKCRFTKTTATVEEKDIVKYLIVNHRDFAVNFMCLGNWGRFYLAYNDSGETYVVSPACSALTIKDNAELNPYYFLYILQRDEFQRKCVFIGDGNTRGGINSNDFGEIKIPLLEYSKQSIIAEMFQAYEARKDLNERLKAQIKEICPILIKGSLEEGK